MRPSGFLSQLASICILLTISNQIKATPPIKNSPPGDIGAASVSAHAADTSPINIDESGCDGKTVDLVLSVLPLDSDTPDSDLDSQPTRVVEMAYDARAATLDSYRHLPYNGETQKIGSSRVTNIRNMPYYSHDALDRHGQRYDPLGSQYGLARPATNAVQNFDKSIAANNNGYQLFPTTSRRSNTERSVNPSPSSQGLQANINSDSNTFASIGHVPAKTQIIRENNLRSDHSSLASHTNMIALSGLQKAANHRGSHLPPPPGFQQSQAHPFAIGDGSSPKFTAYGLQADFVPGQHGRATFRPGHADIRGDLKPSSFNPNNRNPMNVGNPPSFPTDKLTHNSGKMETRDHQNLRTHSLDNSNSGPISSGNMHQKHNAAAGHLENMRRHQKGKEINNDRNIGHSRCQTSKPVTSIRQTSIFPSTDSQWKDETPKISKLISDDQSQRLSQEQAKVGTIFPSIDCQRKDETPKISKLFSDDQSQRVSPIVMLSQEQVRAGNSIEPGASDESESLAEVGENRLRPTLGDFLHASAKNGKVDLQKSNQRSEEQQLSKALEVKPDELRREKTPVEPFLPAPDIKQIIQQTLQRESVSYKRDNTKKKGSDTKRGKAEPTASEAADLEKARKEREKKKKDWEATQMDAKKKRRTQKAEPATGGRIVQDIPQNEKFPVDENETPKTASSDESTKLGERNYQGDSSGGNQNGLEAMLSPKDTVNRSLPATDENSKKHLQAQEMAASLETADPVTANKLSDKLIVGSDESIQGRSTLNQGQSSENVSHLSATSSRPRNFRQTPEVIEEEKWILKLVDHKIKYPHLKKPILSVPLHFETDYASQDRHLEKSFQEYKAHFNEQNLQTIPATSMLAPIKIEDYVFTNKISKVFDVLNDSIRHKDLAAYRPLRLYQFSDSARTKFDRLWGEGTVSDWDKKLEISLMARLALILNLHCKTPHCGISPDYHVNILYDRLRLNHRYKKFNIKLFEAYFQKMLGHAESNRRFAALLVCLQEETHARNWKFWKSKLLGLGGMKTCHSDVFEHRLGISTVATSTVNIPCFSPWTAGLCKMDGPVGDSKYTVKELMEEVYGKEETERRLLLDQYLRKRTHSGNRWYNRFHLADAKKKYGVDLLTVLMVGDALLFGFNNLPKKYENSDLAGTVIDDLLRVFDVHEPWIESPERAWLHNECGGLYQDRLRVISQLHIKSCDQSENPSYKGFLPIWRDLGLDYGDGQCPLSVRPSYWGYPQSAVSIWYRSLFTHQYNPSKNVYSWGETIALRWAALQCDGMKKIKTLLSVAMMIFLIIVMLESFRMGF
ncbi:hypothetical protein PtA15_5A437 [Puccinia triticina]|uniref:Uncharacterized protein n=1 Tax=Puccinia triticina TaxID=208348 RepID=A0ABY7CJL0_9BASI|nr:uncharacterized protein PtA15_5A437 [Puccinia triticina]WAQ84864.1 hypothetical protein PtA15_5A437 [Puccinia triticina]